MSIKGFLASSLLSIAVLCLLAASSASAATLNVVGGQLLGASGVIVNGNSYDVAFVDGTCISLFDGCDEPSDFTFNQQGLASDASQALLDQVFLDLGASPQDYDSSPELTSGCGIGTLCSAITPWRYKNASDVDAYLANNNSDATPDTNTLNKFQSRTADLSADSSAVYAVWTPSVIPEPGTALLMGLGLIALSVRNRREV